MKFALAVLALSTLPLTAYSETGVNDKEIVIGSCAALEGPAKEAGTRIVEGARVYYSWLNDRGGIYGRKIRLISENDGYEPDLAITCFQHLLDQSVFAVGPFYGTPPCAKHATMAELHKVPAVGFASGAAFLYEPFKHYVFTVRADVAGETARAVQHLLDQYKAKRIAALYQNDASGVSYFTHIERQLGERGVKFAAVSTFRRNSSEVDESIKDVRSANPDAVFMLGNFAPQAALLKRAKELGWKPLFIAIGSRDALLPAAGPAAEGVVISQVVPPPDRASLPAIKLYHEAMHKYAPSSPLNYYGLEAFLNAMTMAEGLKRAGKEPTREKLANALETLDNWDIGLGSMKLKFSPKAHQGLEHGFFTVVRDGQLILIDDWSKLPHS